jgi:hypothetical protein
MDFSMNLGRGALVGGTGVLVGIGAGVLVDVAVGGTGVAVAVAVGGTGVGVLVAVAVGGIGVLVGGGVLVAAGVAVGVGVAPHPTTNTNNAMMSVKVVNLFILELLWLI